MASSRQQKALRIGVIQNGVLVDEHLSRRPTRISIGENLKNRFVVLDSGLPASFDLFGFKSGRLCLNFTDEMSGRVSRSGAVYSLRGLTDSGLAERKDEKSSLPLCQSMRGKLEVGEATILFHFVNPPPVAQRPKLPMALRAGFGGFLQNAAQISRSFGLILLTSMLLQVGFVIYLVAAVPPPPRPAGVADLPDQVRMFLAEIDEEPPTDLELTAAELADAADAVESAVEDSDDAEPAEDESPPSARNDRADREDQSPPQAPVSESDRLALARQNVRDSAFFGALTVSDDGTVDPIAQVSNLTDRDVAHVMSRVRRSEEGRLATAAYSGSGDPEAVAAVVTPDVGAPTIVDRDVEVDDRDEDRVRVEPRIRTRPLEPRTPIPSEYQEYLSDAIRSRTRHIQDCYERTLRSDPSAGGRVVLFFTIGTNGRVEEVRLTHNEIGEQFEGCVELRARRWRFDPPSEVVRASKAYSLDPGD